MDTTVTMIRYKVDSSFYKGGNLLGKLPSNSRHAGIITSMYMYCLTVQMKIVIFFLVCS